MPPPPRLQYRISPFASAHPDLTSIAFLFAACACAIFSDMNTLSPLLSIGFALFWLAALSGHGGDRGHVHLVVLYFVLPCLSRAVGAIDYFHLRGISKAQAYGIALAIALPILAFVFLGMVVQKKAWLFLDAKSDGNLSHSLVFPVLFASTFQLLFRFSPIGATGNPAMGLAVITDLPLQQGIVSVFGEFGVVFGVGVVASLGAGSLVGRTPTSHWAVLGLAYAVVEIIGGWNLAAGLWQSPIQDWPDAVAPSLQVSCVCSGHARGNNTAVLMDEIHDRLAAGDDLVVLSEAALEHRITHDQISWPSENPGAAVAVSFVEEFDDDGDKFHNSVELLQAGKSVFRYNKNRPVPIIEPWVVGGSHPPAAVEVSFTPRSPIHQAELRTNATLKVAAAICFDFEFPDLLRRARDADLVIGPSNYWGSLGWNLWSDNRYRAVENGFTLFKCSEDGISGAVDPLGRTLWQRPTLAGTTVAAQVPIRKGMPTFYSDRGGHLFGWVCLLVLTPLCLFRTYRQQRRQPDARDTLSHRPSPLKYA